MAFTVWFALGYFLIDYSEWEVAASIISVAVAVLSVVNIVLYFMSGGEGSTLVTVLLVAQLALMIAGCVCGKGLLALGFVGLAIALWIHLGNALFDFLKALGGLFGGK